MEGRGLQFIVTGDINRCFDQQEFIHAVGEDSYEKDMISKSGKEVYGTLRIDHFEGLNTIADSLVDHLQDRESLRLNSVSRKRRNPTYVTPPLEKRESKPNCKRIVESRFQSREPFFAWLCRKWIVLYVVFLASLAFWAVGLIYANGFVDHGQLNCFCIFLYDCSLVRHCFVSNLM